MSGNKPFSPRDVASFLTVSLIWGSTWLVIKDQIAQSPAGWTVTWRFALAGAGMVALALVRRESLWLNGRGMALAGVLGLLQFCGNFQFVYRSEHYVTSGLVAVMYALLMAPNAILARIFLGAPISRRFAGGSLVAVAGIAVLMVQEYHAAPPTGAGDVLAGVGFALAGILCASSANVIQATPGGRQQALIPLIAWAMVIGALADGALAYGMYGAPVIPPSPRFWAGVGWLAVMGSVVTFPVYFGLIRSVGAGRAAYSNVVVPVVAMALSTLFEGYQWSVLALVGSLLALVGVLIALTGRR